MGSLSMKAFAVSQSFSTPVINVSPKYILIFVPPSIGSLVGIALSSVCISAPSLATLISESPSVLLLCVSSTCADASSLVFSLLCACVCSCGASEPALLFPQAANDKHRIPAHITAIIFFISHPPFLLNTYSPSTPHLSLSSHPLD